MSTTAGLPGVETADAPNRAKATRSAALLARARATGRSIGEIEAAWDGAANETRAELEERRRAAVNRLLAMMRANPSLVDHLSDRELRLILRDREEAGVDTSDAPARDALVAKVRARVKNGGR
jgi:hypothetical protein